MVLTHGICSLFDRRIFIKKLSLSTIYGHHSYVIGRYIVLCHRWLVSTLIVFKLWHNKCSSLRMRHHLAWLITNVCLQLATHWYQKVQQDLHTFLSHPISLRFCGVLFSLKYCGKNFYLNNESTCFLIN